MYKREVVTRRRGSGEIPERASSGGLLDVVRKTVLGLRKIINLSSNHV
jgi:hypothetical protein